MSRVSVGRAFRGLGLVLSVGVLALMARERVGLQDLRAPAYLDFEARLEALNRVVFETLEHGDSRPVSFPQNWLIWTAGLLVPDLRRSQSPGYVVRGGRGLCHDAVAVLIALLDREGIEASMFDLRGHVVAVVERGGRSWIADPDYGFVLEGTLESLAEPEGLQRVRGAVRAGGHDERHLEAYLGALANVEAWRRIPGARLSPRLARIERLLHGFSWAIPLLVLLALAILPRHGQRQRSGAPPARGT